MKSAVIRALTAAAAVAVVIGSIGCTKVNLDNDKSKGSYAIGQQIGKSLKMQNADIEVKALVAGLNDALEGKEGKLKPEEMQGALQKMQEMAMNKAMEAAKENEKKGEEWLAANKAKEGWKSTESGLQYKVETEGTGTTPKDTDVVKVHYTGTLINGEKFDSSVDRGEPAEFPVNGVIPGWTEALKLMKTGSKVKLAIPAKLAYGAQGRPGIPPNSTLLFDVELIEVKAPPAPAKKK
ncbi:MAG TPA: FKBP-type peptidyl-prolyl cis-trans isomerase [Bdellovibrionales bacterium]|nr:FKBP-type peptidyl-prolyl cis-trans isomerase [Bdellovibrionales bacterium]